LSFRSFNRVNVSTPSRPASNRALPSQLLHRAPLWRLNSIVPSLTLRHRRRWASHRHEYLDERRRRRSKSQWRRIQPPRFNPFRSYARPFRIYEQPYLVRSFLPVPESTISAADAEWLHAQRRGVSRLQQFSISNQPNNTFKTTSTKGR
jgi:hypothetical protein